MTQPASLRTLTGPEWGVLIHQAKRAGLLARIYALLVEEYLLDAIPKQPKMHLDSARVIAENEQRILRWELNRLNRALKDIVMPIVLLKGAAYLALNLPNAR